MRAWIALAFLGALAGGRVLVGETGAPGAIGAQGPAGDAGLSNNLVGTSCSPPLFVTGESSCGVVTSVPQTTRSLTVGPADFAPWDSSASTKLGGDPWETSEDSLMRTASTQSVTMIAPLHLPNGAVISRVRCWFRDTVPGSNAGTGECIGFSWARVGPTRVTCSTAGTASADNAATHGVSFDAANALDPSCVLPAQSAIGPSGFVQHQLELLNNSTSTSLVFHGCDVSFTVIEALP